MENKPHDALLRQNTRQNLGRATQLLALSVIGSTMRLHAGFLNIDGLGIGFAVEYSGGVTVSSADAVSASVRDVLGAKELEWLFPDGRVWTYLNPAEGGGWRYLPLCVELSSSRGDPSLVRFPIIQLPRTDSARLLFSDVYGAMGSLVQPDWESVKPGDDLHTAKDSPGFRFAAVVNDGGDMGGVYLDSREEDFSPVRFSFAAGDGGTALMAAEHPQPGSVAGGLVKRFSGDWYAAARIYKAWVSKLPRYQAAKARERGRLRDVSMWFWNRGLAGDVIPPVEKFQSDSGVPAALDWYWWHAIPYDSGYPNFWPPREGEDVFRAAVSRLREAGIFSQTYMNGMTWDSDDPSWAHGGAEDAVVPHRTVAYNVYDGHSLTNLCGESPHFQRVMHENIDALAGCGLDGIYLDMLSAASLEALCHNPAHSHRPGDGAAQVRSWRKFLHEIKERHPGLFLSSEDAGENYFDLFDFLICCFPSYERFDFGVAPRRECVPVFAAIYHEAIPMFGSYAMIDGIPPWDPKWPDENRWRKEEPWEQLFPDQFAVELSRGLVWGLQPTVANFRLSSATDPRFSEDYRFMIDVARFHHANRDLLFDGEMLDSGHMKCAAKAVDFMVRGIYAKEGDFRSVREEALPTILHSVWRAPGGRTAAVLVNWTREKQAYRLDAPDVKGCGAIPARSLCVVEPEKPMASDPVVIKSGGDWLRFDYRKDVESGTALDFSCLGYRSPPAGKHGWAKAVGGGFEFERLPGIPQRFYGVNVCAEGVAPTHEQADLLVSRLVKAGYNSWRIHHHERVIAASSDAFDRFDYLFAKAKAAGLYATTDVFVSRPIQWRDIGVERDGLIDMSLAKGLFLVNGAAFENWKEWAREFFGHVNPYTGLSYAEDPALAFVSLVNEGAFAWRRGAFDLDETRALYRKWLAAKRAENPRYDPDAPEDCLGCKIDVQGSKGYWALMTFVRDLEADFARRARDYLRSIGVKALLTDWNTGPYLRNTAVLDTLDYADTHSYVNHPVFTGDRQWAPPARVGNARPAEAKKALPVWLGGLARDAGKPFTVSEWAYATPGECRSSAGLLYGAAAAMLDWDALWRFDYIYSGAELGPSSWLNFFSVNADPFARFSDCAAVAAFLDRAFEPVFQKGKAEFPFEIDEKTGRFTVVSDRLCGGFGREGDDFAAGDLSWRLEKSDAALWASSLDGRRLRDSERIVLFHLTDLKAEGMKFADPACEVLTDWGGPKLVLRHGRAAVSIAIAPGAERDVWALASDGRRVSRIPAAMEGGRLEFVLDACDPDGNGRCIYEIAAPDFPVNQP